MITNRLGGRRGPASRTYRTKNLKILVISAFTHSLVNIRGPLLATLVRSGHKVITCAPGEDKDIIARLAELGVTYKPVNLYRTGLNPVNDLLTLLRLLKLLRDVRPDILLS